ncbi:insulinase family protein [Lutibacter sp. A80]|uniref:M16 family metallopeptidase n=1 Tax=Lutibacter sp. A80 TaxID=2918453 RepID=UPI001F050DA4|nr:M16 family metallopeptidase [Lutibacter sp. A80]UMB59345.1 insulinase family protein [Lutibacter sp. A80]
MRKFYYLSFFAFFLSFTTFAQEVNLEAPLPVNKKIKKGVLENGMTYYIYSTDVTKNVASYYIIQNVGSVLENDHQQGLAHFLEHMAFNGTKNFEGKGILNTLQKHGAVFGKDINAYTSFDETVYNLDNIPTKDGLVDTALLILNDWSNYLLLTEEEIDAERGVIKEEWRTRQNGQMRVLQQTLPVMFGNSKYSNRLPIGLMDIVENFEYKALRDFYHDWYRTDLQAIAVVGDIDVDEIEQKIIKQFSSIPAVENPKERFLVQIPDHKEMLYTMAMDDEVTTSNIAFSINHPRSLADQTVKDLKESLINSLMVSMLSARISEKTQNPDASFMAARFNFGNFVRSKKQLSLTVYPKPNQQQDAFKEALTELNRAVKFGFTEAEMSRKIAEIKNSYETQIAKINDFSHKRIIRTIQQNYLENETMTDIVEEYEIAKNIFDQLNIEEVNNTLKKLYTKENRAIIVTGVKGNNNLTEEQAVAIINEVENDNSITAYEDSFSGKTLISDVTIKEGTIVSEDYNKEIEATTFTLSNGIKVHYKFADKNENDVRLNATSYGGMSLLEDAELASASLTTGVAQFSGLGDFSRTDLPKVLAGKTASTSVSINSLSESVSGSSSTKDVETMLQMVYLRFEKPRFDEDAYTVLMENVKNYLIRKSENITEKMNDSLITTLYGKNHPTQRIFNQELVDEMSFEKAKAIYLERFNNAADFEFFIVGDVEKENLEPLLEKYIASIETTKEMEMWKDNSTNWVSDTIDKDILLKMEDPKSSVRISYKNDMKYTLKNNMIAKALGDILQLRYTETLREEEGGTYGASARSSLSKRPVNQATLSVNFDCNPDKVDKLVDIVHNEIEKIANGEIQQLDLDKTLTNYKKEREEQKDYNNYDMSLLINFYRENYNIDAPENFDEIVNDITVKDIQNYTKKLLKNAKTYEVVFRPTEESILKAAAASKAASEKSASIADGVSKKSVIEAYFNAIGGVDKIKAIESTLVTYEAEAMGNVISSTEKRTATKYANETSMGGNVMQKIVMSKDGVTMNKQPLPENMASEMTNVLGTFLEMGLLNNESSKLAGIESLDGKDAYVISTKGEIVSTDIYFDVETGLKVKEVQTVSMGGQTQKSEATYSDYKEFNGVKFAGTKIGSLGPQKVEFKLTDAKVNEGVSEEDF